MMINITPIMIKGTAKSMTMMPCGNQDRGRVDLTKAVPLSVTLITTTPFMITKTTPFMITKEGTMTQKNTVMVELGHSLHPLQAIGVWVRQFGLTFTQEVQLHRLSPLITMGSINHSIDSNSNSPL